MLDLDAIPDCPATPQERAAAVRNAIAAFTADHDRMAIGSVALHVENMKRIGVIDAAH